MSIFKNELFQKVMFVIGILLMIASGLYGYLVGAYGFPVPWWLVVGYFVIALIYATTMIVRDTDA